MACLIGLDLSVCQIKGKTIFIRNIEFLAHLAEGQLSLWDGAASVVRPSTFSFK